MLQARSGKTVTRAGKIVRLLTQEEADAHAFIHNPSRRIVTETVKDKDGNEHQQPLVKNGEIVVEEYGSARPQRLGLFDVSGSEPIPFRPTEDDWHEPVELDEEGKEKPRVLRTDWEIVQTEPEVVPPEIVDEALVEHEHPIE